MKTFNLILLLFLPFIFGACLQLNIQEINNLKTVQFDSPCIKGDVDLYDYRIDIIRQTEDERVNDSTTKKVDVPYHNLGVDLGNALFYDLNNNLSLRIDQLLNFNTDEDFCFEKKTHPNKNKGIIYTQRNDSLFWKRFHKNKVYFSCFHKRSQDSIIPFYRKRSKSFIVQNDTTIFYKHKKRILDQLFKENRNHWYERIKRNVVNFTLEKNEIYLNKKYVIQFSEEGNEITIYRLLRKNRRYALKKIIRSENKIFIFNEEYRGRKIELSKDTLRSYENGIYESEYRIIR